MTISDADLIPRMKIFPSSDPDRSTRLSVRQFKFFDNLFAARFDGNLQLGAGVVLCRQVLIFGHLAHDRIGCRWAMAPQVVSGGTVGHNRYSVDPERHASLGDHLVFPFDYTSSRDRREGGILRQEANQALFRAAGPGRSPFR